jgi:PAS domain S-box-containing protein
MDVSIRLSQLDTSCVERGLPQAVRHGHVWAWSLDVSCRSLCRANTAVRRLAGMNDTLLRLDTVRKELVSHLGVLQTTLRAYLAIWRTQIVSLRARASWQEAWSAAWPILVFAAAYIAAWSYLFVAAFLGAHPPPAPLFPPEAVLITALLLTPPRRWWLYLAAAFVIQVPILAYLHLPLWWNLLGYIPDALEPVVAVSLLRRFVTLPPRFASIREVSIYTGCVVAAVLLAATVGSAVNAAGGEPYGPSWRTWFLGDTLANLVLAPTLLLWIGAGVHGLRPGSRWRAAEAALLYGGLLLLAIIVFDTRIQGPTTSPALIYLPVPLLLWAAVRFGPRGSASALSLITVLAIPGVANAMGPFASQSPPAQSTLGNVFTLQLFLLVIGVPLFFLAVLVQERKQIEGALADSEVRYRDLVESQTEMICRYLPDTTLTFVNEAFCRSYGRPREELIGRRFLDLMDAPAREHHVEYTAALLAHPHTSVDEHEVALPDGSVGWQQWVDHAIYDAEGQVVEIQAIGRDITERKRSEAALRESEERYRAFFELNAVGAAQSDPREGRL